MGSRGQRPADEGGVQLDITLIRLDRIDVEASTNLGRERSRHLLLRAGEGTRSAAPTSFAPSEDLFDLIAH
jgi:hypothetical protein